MCKSHERRLSSRKEFLMPWQGSGVADALWHQDKHFWSPPSPPPFQEKSLPVSDEFTDLNYKKTEVQSLRGTHGWRGGCLWRQHTPFQRTLVFECGIASDPDSDTRYLHLKIKGQSENQETFEVRRNDYLGRTDLGRNPNSILIMGRSQGGFATKGRGIITWIERRNFYWYC